MWKSIEFWIKRYKKAKYVKKGTKANIAEVRRYVTRSYVSGRSRDLVKIRRRFVSVM